VPEEDSREHWGPCTARSIMVLVGEGATTEQSMGQPAPSVLTGVGGAVERTQRRGPREPGWARGFWRGRLIGVWLAKPKLRTLAGVARLQWPVYRLVFRQPSGGPSRVHGGLQTLIAPSFDELEAHPTALRDDRL